MIKPHHDKCICEWVNVDTQEEVEEAKTYLQLWKKFYLKQLPSYEFIWDSYHEKKVRLGSKDVDSIGLKIYLKRKEDDESNA